MKRKFAFLIWLLLSSLSYATVIDAIAIIVNNKVITTQEIKKVQKKMKLSKKDAQELLIEDRLQNSAIEKISVTQDDIDKRIEFIASNNNLTVDKIRKKLKKEGTSWSSYRAKLKETIKKEKFYMNNIQRIEKPTDKELKYFYNKNKDSFKIPKNIYMTSYSSFSQSRIKTFLKNKKTNSSIRVKELEVLSKTLTRDLLLTILQVPEGYFTPILKEGSSYSTYEILFKEGEDFMPFEMAKDIISIQIQKKKQQKAIKSYFKKLKTQADIIYLR